MANGKDFRRVRVLLIVAIFLIFFLIVNSEQFRTSGFIFLAMATFAFSVYLRGRIV